MLSPRNSSRPRARSHSGGRYIVNDTTVEKLGEILGSNPNGALIFRDELTGSYARWNGRVTKARAPSTSRHGTATGRFTYDRIGRGTIDIEAACVSILGGIQPGPLAAYMASMARGGAGDDGMMQRFQSSSGPTCPATGRTWTGGRTKRPDRSLQKSISDWTP